MTARFLRLLTLSVWAVLAAGCASGGSTSTPLVDPSEKPIVLVASGMPTGDGAGAFTHSTITGERPSAHTQVIADSVPAVWKTAIRVYDKLDIPVTLIDPHNGQLGNTKFWKTRTIGPRRMGDLIDCGLGATGRNADYYRILLSLTTTFKPQGSGTMIQTLLVAQGQDPDGVSTGAVQCTSTGVLESMINQSISRNVP